MANAKLLQRVDITTANKDFAYTLTGSQTAAITVAEYDTIYEVCVDFETQLQVVDATFGVTVSALGIVDIVCDNIWVVDWAATDNDLESLLGFAGSEAVQLKTGKYHLTGTKRHGQDSQAPPWYAPVGEFYHTIRRFKARRVEATDDGDASTHSSAGTVKTLDVRWHGVLESALEPDKATTSDDGSGGTVDWTGVTFGDWWADTAGKKFRFYFRKADGTVGGTVAAPGTEGTDYWTCVYEGEDLEFDPLDPDGFTYYAVSLSIQITGS